MNGGNSGKDRNCGSRKCHYGFARLRAFTSTAYDVRNNLGNYGLV